MASRAKSLFSERQLLLMMLIVSLLFHVGAMSFLGAGNVVQPHPVSTRPRIRWMPQLDSAVPRETPLAYGLADLFDPSLSALPNPRGFSRPMWKRAIGAARQPLDFSATPAFLDVAATNTLGTLLNEPALNDVVLASLKKLPAEMEEPVGEAFEVPVIINSTVLRVDSAVDAWRVIRAPQWPTITSAKSLVPTRVRAGVAADGSMRFATLESSCGDEAADGQAVELVRQVRFAPLAGAGAAPSLKWVLLSVVWATEPPPAAPATSGKTPNR